MASDIPADGKVIVGYGLNPQGRTERWVANLGTAPSTRDDKTRLLWRHDDGRASVWVVSGAGLFEGGQEFGPFAGWQPRSLGVVDSDNTPRLLWGTRPGRRRRGSCRRPRCCWITATNSALSPGGTP